jgi:uncharacterized Fe-S cluster-containing radical SAM superfamily protein
MPIKEEIEKLRAEILCENEGLREYKVVSSFAGTSAESEKMVFPFLRRFQAIKEERHRKTNVESGFDYYIDSLLDYPSIIQYRMGGDLDSYNMMISIHVPKCPYDCWHCYNNKKLHLVENAEWHTAAEIVDAFLEQRKYDKTASVKSNVLRITGGESFLVPELILDCLDELKKRGLHEEIFVWTETDLYPFIREKGESFAESVSIKRDGVSLKVLEELSKHSNFAVHPCLHGLSNKEIQDITGKKNIHINQLIEGLSILLSHKFDIYPTFGSNVSAPENLGILFQKLYMLNRNLPLRFALVQYDLEYPDICIRLKEQPNREFNLHSKYTNLRIWNTLLKKHYNIGYAVIPRHMISLIDEKMVKSSKNFVPSQDYNPQKQLLYVIKSSYREDYHRELLDIIALPTGSIYTLEYDTNWVQNDLWQHMRVRSEFYKDQDALLLYVDLDSAEKEIVPLRKLKLKEAKVEGNVAALSFELGAFVPPVGVKVNLRRQLESLFGSSTLAGAPLNKYVLVAEELTELSQLQASDDFSTWRETISKLRFPKFEKSLFYRIRVNNVSPSIDPDALGPAIIYEIDSGKRFSIQVDYFLPNYDKFPRDNPDSRKISFESSSDIIKTVTSSQFTISKYGSDTLIFRTEEPYEDTICTIHFQSTTTPFDAPLIDLRIRVKGSGNKIALTKASSLALSGLGGGIITTTTFVLIPQNPNWAFLEIAGVSMIALAGLLGAKYT